MLAFDSASVLLLRVMTSPALEKTRSLATDVAGMHYESYNCAYVLPTSAHEKMRGLSVAVPRTGQTPVAQS